MTCRRAISWMIAAAALSLLVWQLPVSGESGSRHGQLLYVPIYSEIPFGDRPRTLNLTATLSIRNTNRRTAIVIKRVDYHDASGRFVRSYLAAPRTLAPLAAMECTVQQSDRSGGISASFLVEWEADGVESPPLVEAVMIGAMSGQGISFVTGARVLEERK